MKEAALKKELYLEIGTEVEAVLARAGEGAEALLRDALVRREALLEKGKGDIARKETSKRSRGILRARKLMRNRILEFRRAEIELLFDEALRVIVKMASEDGETYGELLWTFFRSGRDTLPGGPLRVRLGGAPEAAVERIGSAGEVEMEKEEGWHGLLVETFDGRVRCDYRLPGLLGRYRREKEAEIEEMLFEVQGEPFE